LFTHIDKNTLCNDDAKRGLISILSFISFIVKLTSVKPILTKSNNSVTSMQLPKLSHTTRHMEYVFFFPFAVVTSSSTIKNIGKLTMK